MEINGDTTNWSSVYTEYQKSVKLDDRLKGSWTIQQYENAYRSQSCLISGEITFRHYYDVDTIKVSIDSYSASMNVYRFAYTLS